MKRYEIFACLFAGLLLVGSVDAADKDQKAKNRTVDFSKESVQRYAKSVLADLKIVETYNSKEEIYFAIPVVTHESTLTSVTVGPCRWSLHTRQIEYLDDTGYEVGLRCTEPQDENFQFTFGVGKNQNEALYVGKGYDINWDDDRSLFISFKRKIGQ